jgi:hypothetical protein
MVVQAGDAQRFQQLGQFGEIVGQREIGGELFFRAWPEELDRVVGDGLEVQHLAAASGKRREIVHVAANAAAPRMGDEYDERLRPFGKPQ